MGSFRRVLQLAGRVANESEGRPFEIQKSFTAVDLGFALGMDIMRIADTTKRNAEAHSLDMDLTGFNVSPHCNRDIHDRLKTVGMFLPEAFNAGYTGYVLREKSGSVIREAAALVYKDGSLAAQLSGLLEADRNRTISERMDMSRALIRGMGDEAVRITLERGNVVEEQIPKHIREGEQYKPSTKERE